MPDGSSFGAFDSTPAADSGVPSSTPSTESGQPSTSPYPGSSTAPASAPGEEPKYSVTVAGQQMEVPLSELLKGYSRTADYTRKTQSLATERQQWNERESQYQTALREAHQILTNRQVLEQYLQSMGASPAQAHQAAATQTDIPGDEVLTYAQAQKLWEERERALEERLLQKQQGSVQELQLQRLTDQYTQTIDQKLDEIATKYPDLPKIPGMDFMLKQAVKMQKPKTVAQATQLLEEAAEYYASQLGEFVKGKVPSSQPAPQVRGIEPPRGTPPAPQANDQTFDSVTDPRLRDTVIADLERMMSARR